MKEYNELFNNTDSKKRAQESGYNITTLADYIDDVDRMTKQDKNYISGKTNVPRVKKTPKKLDPNFSDRGIAPMRPYGGPMPPPPPAPPPFSEVIPIKVKKYKPPKPEHDAPPPPYPKLKLQLRQDPDEESEFNRVFNSKGAFDRAAKLGMPIISEKEFKKNHTFFTPVMKEYISGNIIDKEEYDAKEEKKKYQTSERESQSVWR